MGICSFTLASEGKDYPYPCSECGKGPCKHTIIPTDAPHTAITIYHVYDCEHGEIEGMFSEDGKLLGAWCTNDGKWRGEYFDGFLQTLDIQVKYLDDEKDPRQKLWAAELRKASGVEE
jgi:hypothetical protein